MGENKYPGACLPTMNYFSPPWHNHPFGEQIPSTELLLSQKYWWKADHALLQACYLILRRRKVRSSCFGRRRCRLLSDLVQFCPGSERGLNVATVRGWTSPPYFFTLAASPPIRS